MLCVVSPDPILTGLFNVAAALIQGLKAHSDAHDDILHSFADCLLNECLFFFAAAPELPADGSSDTEAAPATRTTSACLTTANRTHAIMLLSEMAARFTAVRDLAIQTAQKLHWRADPSAKSESSTVLWDAAAGERGSAAWILNHRIRGGAFADQQDATAAVSGRYVGLRNLGATCYMNATLQQMFLIDEFRRDVLRAQVVTAEHSPDMAVGHSSALARNRQLLAALQSTFVALKMPSSRVFDPSELCALVYMDGRPVDVKRQGDAAEFVLQLFQQLESASQGTNHHALVRNSFEGFVENRLELVECCPEAGSGGERGLLAGTPVRTDDGELTVQAVHRVSKRKDVFSILRYDSEPCPLPMALPYTPTTCMHHAMCVRLVSSTVTEKGMIGLTTFIVVLHGQRGHEFCLCTRGGHRGLRTPCRRGLSLGRSRGRGTGRSGGRGRGGRPCGCRAATHHEDAEIHVAASGPASATPCDPAATV